MNGLNAVSDCTTDSGSKQLCPCTAGGGTNTGGSGNPDPDQTGGSGSGNGGSGNPDPDQTGGSTGPGSNCNNNPDLATLRTKERERTNKLRADHGANALTEDSSLNDLAQGWAEKIAGDGSLSHNPDRSKNQPDYIGENAYYSMSSAGIKYNGGEASDDWYSEIKDWDFATNKKKTGGGATGHFTQLVWKGSQRVGHGFAYTSDCKEIYVVANYGPGGNMGGQYAANVGNKV